VSTLVIAAVLHASLASGTDSYADARRLTEETGRPMLVMVGTDWCGPCQQMKKTILPQVRQHGLLRRVAFAMVNADRDQALAQKLTGGGPVPQLVMYRKTAGGWLRRKLVGGQSVETIEQFINEGLAANEAEQHSADTSGGEASAEKTSHPSGSGTPARPVSVN
jgi:thioredoxin-like negative regulator of GroEL